ncbi:MAG: M13 family metallopeptidase [Chitinophagaceae bacterium]
MRKIILPISFAVLAIAACKTEKKETQSFLTVANMDSTVKPTDNFYMFVNGKWFKNTVIPGTESGTGAFLDIYNRTKDNLKTIFTDLAKTPQKEGSIEQQVADFYASGMDSATIEKLGYEPVKPHLKKIDAIADSKSLMQYIAESGTEGSSYLFALQIGADEKNSSMNIPSFYQGGLGLPDRDYYFKNDPATLDIIKAYQTYLTKLFTLTGVDATTAAKNVEAIYNLEKQIANAHLTNVELRDPQTNYNKMAVTALDKSMPNFGWATLLAGMRIKCDSINVGQPKHFANINTLLTATPIDTWKLYLKAHLLNDVAAALSSDFVNANFDYAGKALGGKKQLKPRWERMISATDGNLSEALGQLYVKKYFTEDAKKRMLELINNLQKAFEARINRLDWMSDVTKVKAKDKLHTFLKKIGFPDKWKDYSKVKINKNEYFNNLVECSKNEYNYQVSKVGKPVDRTEWGMTPSTVNAYYNPTFNEIVFPAGILQFPFFDLNADDAINYGGIGMVIGHEMTHGFDDQGAQYDKDGNMQNWWTKEDEAKFKGKGKAVISLYDGFTVLDSLHVKGALTLGENIADIGGIAIAYEAFKMTKQGQDTTKIDGFTPDQRFFISYAQIWRNKQKEESIRQRINTDPHSPPMYRVLAPLMHFEPFYKAFNVKEGDKMYIAPDKRIKIW